jgi:uncharacterized membrane protein YeiH
MQIYATRDAKRGRNEPCTCGNRKWKHLPRPDGRTRRIERLGRTVHALLFHIPFATTVNWFTGWRLTGHFTTVDLIAASANSLTGALLARRPDHYKNFTIVGLMCMALLGGLGGGITRDVLVGQVPGALTNPAYITLAFVVGVVGYHLAFAEGQLFREGLFQFMTFFSLAWYAIPGAQEGVDVGLPVLGTLLLAVVGPTAGRWYIDISSGVTPKQFLRGEWFIGTALLTGLIWVVLDWLIVQKGGGSIWWPTGLAFVIGFAVRMVALYRAGRSRWQRSQPVSTDTTTAARCSATSLRASPSARCTSSAWRSKTTASPAR